MIVDFQYHERALSSAKFRVLGTTFGDEGSSSEGGEKGEGKGEITDRPHGFAEVSISEDEAEEADCAHHLNSRSSREKYVNVTRSSETHGELRD